jgi:hypothetical protein
MKIGDVESCGSQRRYLWNSTAVVKVQLEDQRFTAEKKPLCSCNKVGKR